MSSLHCAFLNQGKWQTSSNTYEGSTANLVFFHPSQLNEDALAAFISDYAAEFSLIKCVYYAIEGAGVALACEVTLHAPIKDVRHALYQSDAITQGVFEVALVADLPHLDEAGLLIMDMDSTAICIECIDEIARLAGRYEEVAKVTAMAMRGEIAFSDSLHHRVAALKGVPLTLLNDLKASLPYMDGIKALCAALKNNGWRLILASGGFNQFASEVANTLKLDGYLANTLDENDDVLAGSVSGKVIDAEAKADYLQSQALAFGIPLERTVAIGDGANDLVMMKKAALGVAVHGKEKVVAEADCAIRKGSLLQLLLLLSVPKAH